MTLAVTPLTPTIGAEIAGADLLNLSDEDFGEIRNAFITHSVIFFRDQPALDPAQQFAFARRFGDIHVHPNARGRDDEFPGLLKMRTSEKTRVASGNRWHSDVSCDIEPPSASILQLHEIPAAGGDTLFASMYAAWDALSDRMQNLLVGLTAHHSGEESYRRLFQFDNPDPNASWPRADHPLVIRHPESGRPALFVNREFTHSINDLPKMEARALLEFLFDHVEQVSFQCRFNWSRNAIAMWDNRCAQHHAIWDYWPQQRSGHRVSVCGEAPVAWLEANEDTQRSRHLRLSA